MDKEQVEVPSLLDQAEAYLKSNHVKRALAILQGADLNAKGVRELLAITEILTAVQAETKRGCGCSVESKGGNDWYLILGVEAASDEAAIKRKFKQYALYCHPDKNSSSRASEAFKWASEAHAVLSDSVQRAMFNKQKMLLEAPCVSCLLKRTTLDERLGYARSVRTGAPETSGSFHSAETFSFEDLRGSFGRSRSCMPDPAFEKTKDASWRENDASWTGGSDDSWRERREKWLSQLDKSKAKAQVRKQAWDDGLRNFEGPVGQKKPPLFTPTAGQTMTAAQTLLRASEFSRKPSNFETLSAFAGTTRAEKSGSRFAVDETKGATDNPRRQVPLTLPTAKEQTSGRDGLKESFEREVLLKGRQQIVENSEEILNGNGFVGGVLRQRRDTNRSEGRPCVFELDRQGSEKMRGKESLFGREHRTPLEKENVEAFGGTTYGLFQQHGLGAATMDKDPSKKRVASAHEQLLSTLRRLKEDGMGTAKSKKVGLSFGAASADTLKNHGYRAVYDNNAPTDVYNSTEDRNRADDLLQRLRELRMDDGRFVL